MQKRSSEASEADSATRAVHGKLPMLCKVCARVCVICCVFFVFCPCVLIGGVGCVQEDMMLWCEVQHLLQTAFASDGSKVCGGIEDHLVVACKPRCKSTAKKCVVRVAKYQERLLAEKATLLAAGVRVKAEKLALASKINVKPPLKIPVPLPTLGRR